MSSVGPSRSAYAALAAIIVALDQATKMLVDHFMTLHESRLLVDGVLRLTYVQNRGAAFGILSDADLPYQSLLFAVVSLGALGAIAAYAWKLPARSVLPRRRWPSSWGRARHPYRPRAAGLRDRLRGRGTGAAITGRPSTSPTPPSAWESSFASSSTSCHPGRPSSPPPVRAGPGGRGPRWTPATRGRGRSHVLGRESE
jgi:hypothetical protein